MFCNSSIGTDANDDNRGISTDLHHMIGILAVVEQFLCIIVLWSVDVDRKRVDRSRDSTGKDMWQLVACLLAAIPCLIKFIDD